MLVKAFFNMSKLNNQNLLFYYRYLLKKYYIFSSLLKSK